MASTRRRGAHAAAAPDTATTGGTAATGPARAARGARGPGKRAGGFRARLSPLRVVIAVLVLGFFATTLMRVCSPVRHARRLPVPEE